MKKQTITPRLTVRTPFFAILTRCFASFKAGFSFEIFALKSRKLRKFSHKVSGEFSESFRSSGPKTARIVWKSVVIVTYIGILKFFSTKSSRFAVRPRKSLVQKGVTNRVIILLNVKVISEFFRITVRKSAFGIAKISTQTIGTHI